MKVWITFIIAMLALALAIMVAPTRRAISVGPTFGSAREMRTIS